MMTSNCHITIVGRIILIDISAACYPNITARYLRKIIFHTNNNYILSIRALHRIITLFFSGYNDNIFHRLCLYRHKPNPCRQGQDSQQCCRTVANALTLFAVPMGQLGHDDVLVFYFAPYDFIYLIHTLVPPLCLTS